MGGFQRFEGIEAATPSISRRHAGRGMKAPNAGKQAMRETRTRPWRGRSGARSKRHRSRALKQEARTQLTHEGRFEEARIGDIPRTGLRAKAMQLEHGLDDQLVNERASRDRQAAIGVRPVHPRFPGEDDDPRGGRAAASAGTDAEGRRRGPAQADRASESAPGTPECTDGEGRGRRHHSPWPSREPAAA